MKSVYSTLAVLTITAVAASAAPAQSIYPVGFCGFKGCGPSGCGTSSCGTPSCGTPSCGAPACAMPSCGAPGCGAGMAIPAAPPVYPYGGGPWNGGCIPVMPCCPPFNGMLPPMNNNQGLNGGCPLPQHPYARGPRDYFMYYERQ